MTKVYGNWWGGPNYAQGGMESVEEFESVLEMILTAQARYDNADGTTPNVTSDSQFWGWLYDPREVTDPYPDFLIVHHSDDTFRKVNA